MYPILSAWVFDRIDKPHAPSSSPVIPRGPHSMLVNEKSQEGMLPDIIWSRQARTLFHRNLVLRTMCPNGYELSPLPPFFQSILMTPIVNIFGLLERDSQACVLWKWIGKTAIPSLIQLSNHLCSAFIQRAGVPNTMNPFEWVIITQGFTCSNFSLHLWQ